MGDKITKVTVNNPTCNNPACEVFYKFAYSIDDFIILFQNQLTNCGYFVGTTMDGTSVTISPNNSSFIDIREMDFKAWMQHLTKCQS